MVSLASLVFTVLSDPCLLLNYNFPAGIPHIDTGSEEISSNKKMRGTEKACVGQLCHIEEQLQLYVEESFPCVSRKRRSTRCLCRVQQVNSR